MLLMVVKEYLGGKKNFENIMDFIFIFSNFRNKVMREKTTITTTTTTKYFSLMRETSH